MADFDAFAKAQPVLFVYGADKGLMFHTTKQLEQFKTASFDVKTPEGSTKTLKSQVLGIEKAGDYVYKQENDVCIKAVGKLLSELRVLPRTSPGARYSCLLKWAHYRVLVCPEVPSVIAICDAVHI
eukprot:6185603-Pleurochrysis_carterae.AAC.10